MKFLAYSGSLMASLVLGLAVGCSKPAAGPATPPAGPGQPPAQGHEEHGHATEGPHGGHLIELGKEEYHAEMVHDDAAGTVTIYVLDSSAKKPVAIEASEIVINLKHAGKPEQFKLAASPDQGDPAGKSSRFMSNDKELGEDLDAEGADAQLMLEINGTQYRGAMHHEEHAPKP